MRIDQIEFSDAMTPGNDAHGIISEILDLESPLRKTLRVKVVDEYIVPSIDLSPGGSCWQISPHGHPMTTICNPISSSRSNGKMKVPLHTFNIFSPPIDPDHRMFVEHAARHIIYSESLTFLSLIFSMVGGKWDRVSKKDDIPSEIDQMMSVSTSWGPSSILCDKDTFDSTICKMDGFHDDDKTVNGTQITNHILTIKDKDTNVFWFDVTSPDGGMVLLCSKNLGTIYECGGLKFWKDQSGPGGVFSTRISISLMSRNAVFAINKRG